MAQFLNSVFLGRPGIYQIFGIQVEYPESIQKSLFFRELKAKDSESSIVHSCFTKAFRCMTLKDPMRFVYLMECLIASKFEDRLTKSNTNIEKIKVSRSFMSLYPVKSEEFDDNRFKTINKIIYVFQVISHALILMSAKVLATYITKPVAVILAASSIYWGAHKILFALHIRGKLDNEDYGWKGNTALVATYALSVFAASQLI